MTKEELDDIRPYNDSEINDALKRLTAYKQFKSVLKFLFPESEHEKIINLLNNIHSAFDFQSKFMRELVFSVVKKSSTDFAVKGIENIDKNTPYLFISNHRDIVLDSAILQAVLNKNGFPTTEITFGSNLMSSEFLIDFGKTNRMFKVYRGGNPREILKNSQVLSEYIRHTITEKKASVWIAQRNGRTKNGDDKTEMALLKMLNMSGKGEFYKNINELNILPVTISYEIEPCCLEKVKETYISSHYKYVKSENEDLLSIIKGLTEQKGKIQLSFGKKIEITKSSNSVNLQIKELAEQIDRTIYWNYMFRKNNYISYDLLYNSDKYSDKYLESDKNNFINYMDSLASQLEGDKTEIRKIFLGVYAYPLINLQQRVK